MNATPRLLEIVVVCLVTAGCAAPVTHDVVIRGGTVYDGSGNPGVVADIAADKPFKAHFGSDTYLLCELELPRRTVE